MGLDRVKALRAERGDVLSFCRDLSDEDWRAASQCPGWTIKDVVSHMAAACHGTFTPWVVKMMRSKALERSNDADVEARRGSAPAKILQEYEVWSGRFGAVQPALQRPPLARVPIRLGELGTYPASLLASAIVFDTYLHLRHDMAPALGRAVARSDARRLAVALEWMMAGLPAMSGHALDWMDRPAEIHLSGGGGGMWGVMPHSGGPMVKVGPVRDPAVTIEGAADEFPIWGTGRASWRSSRVSLRGDEDFGGRFLDSLRVV